MQAKYFCQECKMTVFPRLLIQGQEKEVPTYKRSDGLEVRKLDCGHEVDAKDLPSEHAKRESNLGLSAPLAPEEYREINVTVTKEFAALQDDDARETFIRSHIEEYEAHLQAAKKEKYIVQVLEDLTEKYMNNFGEDETKRLRQRFDYIFKRPDQRIRIAAQKEVREEKKQKTVDATIEKMRELMRRSGLSIDNLDKGENQ